MGQLSSKLFRKILGESRVESLNHTYLIAKSNLKSRVLAYFDTSGHYFPIIFKIYKWVASLTIFGAFFFFLLKSNFLWLTGKMPGIEELQNPKLNQTSTIISADGLEIGKFYAENRSPVDSSEISPWVFKALIATEDKRFFEHSGIDLRRMASVAVGVVTGTERGGGSTVSQQLAKNLYNTRRKEMKGVLAYIPLLNTLIYKSKEWITSIELEERFTKGEILTLYLNTVDYGNNSFGIKTAAKTYFNKLPAELTPDESAILVGLQKATTRYNPIRNPENAKRRRNTVLELMAQGGYLTPDSTRILQKKEIVLDINLDDPFDGQGDYFKVFVGKMVQKWSDDNDLGLDIYRDGLRIYTTIDSRMQSHAENAVATHMKVLQKDFDQQWGKNNPWVYENGKEIPGYLDSAAKRTTFYKKLAKKYNGNRDSVNKYMNQPKDMIIFSYDGEKKMRMSHMDSLRYYKKFLQTGMMAFDPVSGFIKSWVGGVHHKYFKYDHVKQGKRQPGSTFKPVVYATAIDGPLNLSPCDKRVDKEVKTEWVENGVKKSWSPKNSGGRFSGANLTLRSALARSVNSVAVQITLEVGPKNIVDYGKKLGITSHLDPVGSIGLGTSDVSLYEMVAAYGVFQNEGEYTEPLLVYRIEDKNGKLLAEFTPNRRQAIRPESAFLMEYMMRGNVEEAGGTGRRLFNYSEIFKNNGQVAGKTGTTSNNSDAWYIGYTKDLVCGVWVGADDRSVHFRSSMGEGSRSALPIFGIYMNKVYGDPELEYVPGPFPKPSVKIEKDYQGCYNSELQVAYLDSTFNSMLKDTLRHILSRDTILKIEMPSLKRRIKMDTSNLKFKVRE